MIYLLAFAVGVFVILAILRKIIYFVGAIFHITRKFFGDMVLFFKNKLTGKNPAEKKLETSEKPTQKENDPVYSDNKTRTFGISGKCEICGQDFSPTNSYKNYLKEVTYDFYGRERTKQICKSCLSLIREDVNCKIK